MNTISEYAQSLLDRQHAIRFQLDRLEEILSSAERGAMGLTLDSAKTVEWREAKKQYVIVWKAYQDVNKALTKIRKVSGYETNQTWYILSLESKNQATVIDCINEFGQREQFTLSDLSFEAILDIADFLNS